MDVGSVKGFLWTRDAMPTKFQFCRVCRQNHDQGKGHRFATKHKQRLDALQKKIQKNVEEVTFFLKNAMRLESNIGKRSKFWCHICEQEIREDQSIFACAETIRHLASKKHLEAVKTFWFENGGDVSKRQAFYISDVDLGKWEEACKALHPQDRSESNRQEMNNIHSERCPADATSTENVDESSVFCGSSLAVKPLSVLTDQSFVHSCHADGKVQVAAATASRSWAADQFRKAQFEHEAHVDGKSLMQDTHAYTCQDHWHRQVAPAEPGNVSSAQGSVSNLPKTQSGKQVGSGSLSNYQSTKGVSVSIRQTESALGQNLTAIRPPSLNHGEGNVHSGAPPPWLKYNSDQGSGLQASVAHAANPSLHLSRTQQRKFAKLRNPNRVGAAWAEQHRAEMERERRGEVVEKSVPDSSSWLPNFGRVWQSGSRRETRKEFEAEKRSEGRKRSSGQTKRSINVTLDTLKIRPYVSKRQRTMEGSHGVKQESEVNT